MAGYATQRNSAVLHAQTQDQFLENLMQQSPGVFDTYLKNADSLRIQIIYTRIDRDARNRPHFTDFTYHLDRQYFYPASTVKMPLSFLSLEKLHELNKPGVEKFTPMITDSSAPGQEYFLTAPLSANGAPSIAHYIKQIFLISDNDACNRLYEFLGQQYIKDKLTSKGFPRIEMKKRLSVSLTDEQNRYTNAVHFLDTGSHIIYSQPPQYSNAQFSNIPEFVGTGYIDQHEKLVMQPYSMTYKNRFPLADLHHILTGVIFPDPKKPLFNLTSDDYHFLYRYMSAFPRESRYPNYDTTEFFDTYCKFIYFGSDKTRQTGVVRSFNKPGWSYGFLTDIAYIADFENNVEFLLSATIYCNQDGILNDDKYDYDSLGQPFLKNLGQTIYQYELHRKRPHIPDLSAFKIDYSKEY